MRGAGAAAFTNVPRANLVMFDVGLRDLFKLSAEKGGANIGWKNEDGTPRYHQYIAHSQRGIFWEHIADDESKRPNRKGKEARRSWQRASQSKANTTTKPMSFYKSALR